MLYWSFYSTIYIGFEGVFIDMFCIWSCCCHVFLLLDFIRKQDKIVGPVWSDSLLFNVVLEVGRVRISCLGFQITEKRHLFDKHFSAHANDKLQQNTDD